MKIRLDRTVCDGFGICAKHAPGYFSLDDWGYASLMGDGTVAGSRLPRKPPLGFVRFGVDVRAGIVV